MIEAKPRGKEEKNPSRQQNHSPPGGSGRQDTWTDHSKPLYDGNGNQVGTYNDNSSRWDNDRR
jgi:hypothetical protein